MVKVLFLSLLVAMMCGLASTLPAPQLARSFRQELFVSTPPSTNTVLEDPATRNERSTNLSYITGTARKIQLFIKNRHLQLLPDGTVNGTDDASSIYTILQRMTVGVGKMKIQGVSTCQYLCMDCTGMLYGSREFTDDCVFNELIEPNHYNTYYSTKYSNDKRRFYVALNGRGQPKKIILKSNQQLGHRASFTRGITLPADKIENAAHPVRHHAHLCSVLATEASLSNREEQQQTTNNNGRPSARCPKTRKKKKKKKKKCENCNKSSGTPSTNTKRHNKSKLNKVKKCEHNKNSEECQRAGIINSNNNNSNNNNNNNKKRQKKFGGDRQQTATNNKKKKKNNLAKNKKRLLLTTTTEVPSTVVTLTTEEGYHDEDYALDNSTHWDWDGAESSTSHPEESTSSSTTTTIVITHPD